MNFFITHKSNIKNKPNIKKYNNNNENKNTKNLHIITILILLAQLTIINSSKITSLTTFEKPCLYTFSDNTSVDLSPLRKEKDFTFPVGRYIYKGNFCGKQVDKCSGLSLPASIYIRRILRL
jgi:hypothetical protein